MANIRVRPELLVIGLIPDDFRAALSAEYSLIDHILEGPNAVDIATLPRGHGVIVTRAMCGVPPAVMDMLPETRLVVSLGAGLEKIDVAGLDRRGIKLVHTPDDLTEDVADFAIGLAYAARRRIAEGDRFVRGGRWGRERLPFARNLSRARAGVIGMGRIGRRIAEKATALGMPVRYTSPTVRAGLPYGHDHAVAALAAASDVLFVACAGSPETTKLVDADVLAALGPGGILVNIARGSVVDEQALIAALESGTLGGAALDVYENEPAIDPRLMALENVVLSPHAASFTLEAREAMIGRLLGGVRAYFGEADPGAPPTRAHAVSN